MLSASSNRHESKVCPECARQALTYCVTMAADGKWFSELTYLLWEVTVLPSTWWGQVMLNELTPFWRLLIYLLINMMQYVGWNKPHHTVILQWIKCWVNRLDFLHNRPGVKVTSARTFLHLSVHQLSPAVPMVRSKRTVQAPYPSRSWSLAEAANKDAC